MRKIISRFKKIIRFSVTIFASREFAFIYCILGTLAQLAHTYFLTESVSSLSGNWKVVQAIIVSAFISSSLLFFVAIADNEKTKESRRINVAVNLFMFVEIVINIYYYSRHLIIDVADIKIFDFIFGLLVSCLIPITIKLYARTIRAKEWMIEMEGEQEIQIKDFDVEKINSIINQKIVDFFTEHPNTQEFDINEIKNQIMQTLDTDIATIFDKNQNLFLKQFENKCKLMMNTLNVTTD